MTRLQILTSRAGRSRQRQVNDGNQEQSDYNPGIHLGAALLELLNLGSALISTSCYESV
jgi:hypothetical protein